MYLVAREVMSDLTRLQLLPLLFEKKPVENADSNPINLTA